MYWFNEICPKNGEIGKISPHHKKTICYQILSPRKKKKIICWIISDIWSVQKHVNLVDLVKSFQKKQIAIRTNI